MDILKNQEKEQALAGLLDKYGITTNDSYVLSRERRKEGSTVLLSGYELIDREEAPGEVPLLSWRVGRSFTELRKMVADSVVEHACLLRFSCLASPDGWPLPALLYREADLCEYIGGGKTASVFAVWDQQRTANVILKLDTGLLCSIEISLQLPAGSALQERHEIIGRRGTASDRVVDTQVPQQSVYLFGTEGEKRYTDTDMELFGFGANEAGQIRAAFEMYRTPGLREVWAAQHRRLVKVVKAAAASAEQREKIMIR